VNFPALKITQIVSP